MVTKTGKEAARAVANKLKKDKEKKENQAELSDKEIVSRLTHGKMNDLMGVSDEMAKMYRDNALVGTENISQGKLPLLKIHAVGRSKNELADGGEPRDGFFFYAPTQEQFEEVECHILTVSAGFRTPPLNPKPGEKDKFNQLMAGVITNNGNMSPFFMFINGMKLAPMWEFMRDEMSKHTRNREFPVPMFALHLRLSTKKVKTPFGDVWTLVFEMLKDKKGLPKVVTDLGEFQFLRDSVDTATKNIKNVISNKSSEDSFNEAPHPAEVTDGEMVW